MLCILPSHSLIKIRHQIIYLVNSVKGKKHCKISIPLGWTAQSYKGCSTITFFFGKCLYVCAGLCQAAGHHFTLHPAATGHKMHQKHGPKGFCAWTQRGPKYCRREQQQLSPVSNTKPLHPSKREEICVIQCKMCFCSSETFPVLKCNWFFFFLPNTLALC